MSATITRRLVTIAIALLLFFPQVSAAATFNGTVEEVSVDDKTVTVKLTGKKGESKTFNLAPSAAIVVDGKKGQLSDVAEGQTAMIVANASEQVTRLTLKTPKNATAKKSTPKKSMDNDGMAEDMPWPQFRGPNRDNISPDKGLLARWPDNGPKLNWQASGLGEGYSSVSVARGKIYTMGTKGDEEMVHALNPETGKVLWSTPTEGRTYKDGGQGNGPRGTPTVDEDRVYALGANGDLICLGAEKGERIWQKNILEEYGAGNITWGISESVLVDGNNVICTPGGRDGTIVAIDKYTGRGVWKCVVDGAPKAAYSSVLPIEFEGERIYVNYVHTAVIAIRAKDGKLLWGSPESANDVANCSTQLYADGMVFSASGYGKGCAMFKLAKGGYPKLAYANKEMINHHGGMVLLDGFVYGTDDQALKCVDLKSGKTAWKDRSVGKGSLTYADGHLYLRGENGKVALCKATNSGYEELGRFDPPNRSDRPAWAHPVVCGGKFYLRDMDTLVAYDVKGK